MKEPAVGDPVEGRYVLVREIARGAAGTVYEAEHIITRRPVALKIMHFRDAHNAEKRQRFLLEARALVLARQPNVVEVLDAGLIENGVPYVVMELLEGRTLEGLLTSQERLEVANVVHVGRQITYALAHMHRRGLIHRDVKPSNLLVARTSVGQEVVKLIDFGIVRVRDAGNEPRRLTQLGAILGTPEYMAPEQLLDHYSDDPRCDVYSAGVTLYECLTGRVPFEGKLGELLVKLSTTEAPPIAESRPETPRPLASLIERAIARDPQNRFQTAQEFLDALTVLAIRMGPRTPLLGIAGTGSGQSASEVSAGRRFPRVPYLTPVRVVRSDGSVLDGRSEDISQVGLLVVLQRPLDANEQVEIRFALPMSGRIVTSSAKACWARTSRKGVAAGLNVRLDSEDSATIGYYVATFQHE